MQATQSGKSFSRQFAPGRFLATAALAGMLAAECFGCSNPTLSRPPPPVVALDDELAIQGEVCSSPPANAVFPVKILFLVDVSGSLIVTDPGLVRVQGIESVIQKYLGFPGVEFGVITFNSTILQVESKFTADPDLAAVKSAIEVADDLTDTQGVLGAAYEFLSEDMLASTPAERARSKYIIILFTDGIPDPVCSADTTPCGSQSCKPGTHCVPQTVLSASSMETETYSCTDDYPICTVPKKDWGTAFDPPLSPSLYPALMAGANYNTMPQIMTAVGQIMQLQGQYHVGSITLNTNLLFPVAALSNPLAAPFDLDRPYAEELLTDMAAAGNGQFQEFTSATQINFLNINFAALQVQNSLIQAYASNQMGLEIGSALDLDSDGDGLTDAQETSLGTCAALSAKCPTPWDTDGDGYSDWVEVLYRSSGFDPLDPEKPATPCLTPGVDSDGDGLMDCEEAFLGTEAEDPDTDGDLVSDLTEVRHAMNPLDPSDAFGDINKDGILNGNEIELGLSPNLQVSSNERAYSFSQTFEPIPSNSASTGTCYNFSVQHLRLVTPAATPASPARPEGYNRVYYDVFETAQDSPASLSTVRRACADVLYVDGKVKVPLTSIVNFVDSDFVDLAKFNAAVNCKDFTKGVTTGSD